MRTIVKKKNLNNVKENSSLLKKKKARLDRILPVMFTFSFFFSCLLKIKRELLKLRFSQEGSRDMGFERGNT